MVMHDCTRSNNKFHEIHWSRSIIHNLMTGWCSAISIMMTISALLIQHPQNATLTTSQPQRHKFSPGTIPNPYQWKNPIKMNIFFGKKSHVYMCWALKRLNIPYSIYGQVLHRISIYKQLCVVVKQFCLSK